MEKGKGLMRLHKTVVPEKKILLWMFLTIFTLIFIRYCYYGFSYWPQLDDYIQYHNYTAYNSDLFSLINSLGLLSSRPLAGLADIFVWSRFNTCMIAAIAIISAMYAASSVFFYRVFSRHFGTAGLFFVIYALLPLGFEGTYWLSASSRIVSGLFFSSLSLLFFDKWCEKGRVRSLISFALFQLAAFCFYEQIIFLSAAATLVIMLLYYRRNKTRARWGLLMFAGAAVYFAITKLAAPGIYGERAELFLPWHENWMSSVFLPLGAQIKEVFTHAMSASLGLGLKRGFILLFSEPNIIYIIIVLLLCTAMYFTAKRLVYRKFRFWAELVAGLFLTAAPLLPFFLIQSPWFGVRNAVPSFLGFALMGDAVFELLFGRIKKASSVKAGIVSLLCLLCCIASISELHDYKETYEADTQIAKETAEKVLADGRTEEETVWLLNVDASYVKNANFYYHEHGYGVTSSNWALTGAVEYYAGKDILSVISPVSRHRAIDTGLFNPETAFCYYYTGEDIISVSFSQKSARQWSILDSMNNILATIQMSDDGTVQLLA